MGIVNRSMDTSEQKEVQKGIVQDTVTGEAEPIFHVPHAMQLSAAKSFCLVLSGAPTSTLQISRFIAGAGNTVISISSALTLAVAGTSGPQSFALSSTALQLQSGDVVSVAAAGTNAAVRTQLVSLVVQSLQDIKSYY